MSNKQRTHWVSKGTLLGLFLLGLLPITGYAALLPPIITTQPASQMAAIESPVTFQVEVSSMTSVSYQWRKNGVDIAGATSSSYTIVSVQSTDEADYSVRVSNLGGSAISSNAILTVVSAPTQVNNLGSTASEGGTHTISNTELRYDNSEQTASSVNYTVTTSPANGQLELTTNPGVAITSFTQAQIDANQVVYVHNGSATTSDEFKFDVDDGQGNTALGQYVTGVANETNLTTDALNDREAVWSPDGTQIAFRSNRHGNDEIYVMNANGTGVIRLTNNSDWDGRPSWSPDGSQIAFQSDRDGTDQIYVMNADGSGQTPLSNNLDNDTAPSWSPDGAKIIFKSDRDGKSQIYAMDTDGTNQVNLSNNAFNESGAAWSPDGSKIVFVSDRHGSSQIYVMNADGSGQARITNTSDNETNPGWSPDGAHIAFKSDRHGNNEIYVMRADGSQQTRLTNDAANDGNPEWSPDGSQIVFQTAREGQHEICVADVLRENRFVITVTIANAAPVAVNDSYSVQENSTLVVAPPTANLANWWKFDDGETSQAVVDSGALGNDGTRGSSSGADASDPAWTSGFVGAAALSFDGADDYVSTPSTVVKTADAFTLSVWFKTDTTIGPHHILWAGYSSGNGYGNQDSRTPATCEMNLSVGNWNQDHKIVFFLGYDVPEFGGEPISILSASDFTDTDRWHHAAVTVTDLGDGTFSASLYVDGVLEGTDTGVENDRSHLGSMRIGQPGASTRRFKGQIDEVRVYDSVLSVAEIQGILQAGVLENDSDVDSQSITVNTSVITAPDNGSLTMNSDGSFTYVPNPDFVGTDTFTYSANDGLSDSSPANVTVTVTAIPPPVLSTDNSPGMTAEGFSFYLSVPVGATYVIEASDNMTNWTPIATNVAASASMEFTDPAAAGLPMRFYRAVVQ